MENFLERYKSPFHPNRFEFALDLLKGKDLRRFTSVQDRNDPIADDQWYLMIDRFGTHHHYFASELQLNGFLEQLQRCSATTTVHITEIDFPIWMAEDAPEFLPIRRFLGSVQAQGNLCAMGIDLDNISNCVLELVRESTNLHSLTLVKQLSTATENMRPLAVCIQQHPSITQVRLQVHVYEGNFPLEQEAQNELNLIGRALVHTPKLNELELESYVQLDQGGERPGPCPLSVEVINAILQRQSSCPLLELLFNYGSFNTHQCRVLASGIATSPSLQGLHLKKCSFSNYEEAYQVIFSGIRQSSSKSFVELELELYRPLSIQSAVALYDLLSQKEELHTFKLEEQCPVSFRGTGSGPDYAAYVTAKCLARNITIQHLVFTCHCMESMGYEDLEEALRLHGNNRCTTTRHSVGSSVAAEIVKSLKTNYDLVSVDFRTSIPSASVLQEIAQCFSKTCSLQTLIIESHRLFGRTFDNKEIVAQMKIALELAFRCPSLTKIAGDFTPRPLTPEDEAQEGSAHQREQERQEMAMNQRQIDACLRFNREGRDKLCKPNTKCDVVMVLSAFKEDLSCLYEAVKLSPILFE